MCRIDCILFDDYKGGIVRELHKKGIAEIEFLDDDYLDGIEVERDRPAVRVLEMSELLLRVRKISEILARFDEGGVPFLENMLGVERFQRVSVGDFDYKNLVKHSEGIIKKVEDDTLRYERVIPELESRESDIKDRVNEYRRFRGIDPNIEFLGESKYLYTAMGLVQPSRLESLREGLMKRFEDEYVILEGEGEDRIPVVISVPKEKRDDLVAFLRDSGFDQVSAEGTGRVSELLKGLKSELEAVKRDKDEAVEGLKNIHKEYYKKILVVEELLSLEKKRDEIFINCGRTEKTSLMRLWVPKRDSEEIVNIIKRETRAACVLVVEDGPDDAPILLENPKPLNSFEMLTRLFSLPRYREIDPTLFLVPTFCLFFGIMLTDAVYGVILILASLWIRRKYGHLSRSALDLSTVFIGCGIAAIILGIVTGSYLGDFLGKYVLGKSSQEIALWIDPMYNGNAMTFLIAVCVMGFLHLYGGHLLGAYDRLRNGMVMEALQENISWYLLFFGSLIAITTYSGILPLPEFMLWPGILMVLISLILLYRCYGFLFFTNIIGLVGNTLSYARLLAMSLTTAGIAMSFNFLASMALDIPLIGVVIAALVFISGHVINILINSLGAFVHALRLHYVEHFGTYYAGGGRPFQPFREERRHSY